MRALPLTLATLIPLLYAVSAQAQATATFVSGQGNDANPCSRAAPCRSLQAAVTQTAAGGEVDILDSAGYGGATITKAISIVSDGVAGGVTATSGGTAIAINAGPNDVINLQGLDIEGQGSAVNGIVFNSGAALNIQNCIIRNFTNSGINFAPSTASTLSISDTLVSDNFGAGTGIIFQNMGSGTGIGALSRVEVANNGTGISVIDSLGIGSVNVTVDNSVVANNSTIGILAEGSAASGLFVVVTVANSTIVNNGIGIKAESGATAQVSQSTVAGNVTGMLTATGGQIASSGNNNISGNINGNSPPPTGLLLDASGGLLLDTNGGNVEAL
jgi:hypothetical protein